MNHKAYLLTGSLLVIGVLLCYFRVKEAGINKEYFSDISYNLKYRIFWQGQNKESTISCYIPKSEDRQYVKGLSVKTQEMTFSQRKGLYGLLTQWRGKAGFGPQELEVSTTVHSKSLSYSFRQNSKFTQPLSTKVKQSEIAASEKPTDPEITNAWNRLTKEQELTPFRKVRLLFNYISHDIDEDLMTSNSSEVLTRSRGNALGKSRLFISMAKQAGIEARLVSGLYINKEAEFHYWAELHIDNRWVPFDTYYSSFAELRKEHIILKQGGNTRLIYGEDNVTPGLEIVSQEVLSSPNDSESLETKVTLSKTLKSFGLDAKGASIFILFPLCAFIIAALRNVVGISTFGTFLPMLIAAACQYTSLSLGIFLFFVIITLAAAIHFGLSKLHLLKVPRLAAVITIITMIMIISARYFYGKAQSDFSLLTMFPVVILTFTAEKLNSLIDDHSFMDALKLSVYTIIATVCCFFVFESVYLRNIFMLVPEAYIIVLAFQVAVGSWSGMRLLELFRFYRIMPTSNRKKTSLIIEKVLGVNARNKNFIYPFNKNLHIMAANDKAASKNIMQLGNIPVPETHFIINHLGEIDKAIDKIKELKEFVIKPSHGARGDGIMVVTGKDGDLYLTSDKKLTLSALKFHLKEILCGAFSQNGHQDSVILEALIHPHEKLKELSPYGLTDIRVLMANGVPFSAMLRLPTSRSHGKANLHQGAIGVPINIANGVTGIGRINGEAVETHPDTGIKLEGHSIPFWQEILEISRHCYRNIPLGYSGVDISLDQKIGPIVLEINAHPGLEIQNVQQCGIKTSAEALSYEPQLA